MAIEINGRRYYRTLEACQKAGVSRATLFRWLKAGVLADVMPRDRKGWRLFTDSDINTIKSEATRVTRKGAIFEDTREWTSKASVRGDSYGKEDSGY